MIFKSTVVTGIYIYYIYIIIFVLILTRVIKETLSQFSADIKGNIKKTIQCD